MKIYCEVQIKIIFDLFKEVVRHFRDFDQMRTFAIDKADLVNIFINLEL